MENCVAEGILNRGRLLERPPTLDLLEEDSSVRTSSSSWESNDSENESNRRTGLCTSIQVLSESVLRMEGAEMEMLKAREAWRVEAERKSVELENEMTQMLMNTQLQIASFLSQTTKRKRLQLNHGDHDSAQTQRQGLLMLGLLQCNLSFL